jgi:hypothetical protein
MGPGMRLIAEFGTFALRKCMLVFARADDVLE